MNLKEIVADYEANFSGKRCDIFTNYKSLPFFTVVFQTEDLFHLLGLHKLNTGLYASSWVQAVSQNRFELNTGHQNFKDVKPRIANYSFLHEIFYQDKVKICILDKDLSKNTMKLSVVFYKEEKKKVVVLGLRKDKLGYFRLSTLHESRYNRYKSIKTTSIRKITWSD